MSVRREWEAPRVTLPYSDEQWEQIQALGHEIDGELTVKRLEVRDGRVRLLAENDRYPPIELAQGVELEVWGVVTSVVHSL